MTLYLVSYTLLGLWVGGGERPMRYKLLALYNDRIWQSGGYLNSTQRPTVTPFC